jgi:hypothetical protein
MGGALSNLSGSIAKDSVALASEGKTNNSTAISKPKIKADFRMINS